MDITVKNLYIKGSPRKIRPVLHGLRGMSASNALINLKFTRKLAASYILDLVKSGIAAAKEQYLEPDKIFIESIACNEGPRLKRIQPWSKGQSRRITKRRSHLVLVLSDKKQEDVKADIKEEKTNNKAITKHQDTITE
ncbi:MAG TPA: uL22 family ribosomal protein [bacterium]|nr:uL22 family ribosomal protein [bacterium]